MENHIRMANIVAEILDNRFSIFGFRFGINAILDLFPEIGDVIAALLSLYIIWVAAHTGVPKEKISKMFRNVVGSFLVGLVPIAGDIAYIFFRPNARNIKLLNEHNQLQKNT